MAILTIGEKKPVSRYKQVAIAEYKGVKNRNSEVSGNVASQPGVVV
jgi:hypothetical protein